jgi:hypothetical protein
MLSVILPHPEYGASRFARQRWQEPQTRPATLTENQDSNPTDDVGPAQFRDKHPEEKITISSMDTIPWLSDAAREQVRGGRHHLTESSCPSA